MNSIFILAFIISCSFVFLFNPDIAQANYEFSPINMELSTSGPLSSKIIHVRNRKPEPIGIKIRLTHRIQKIDGTELRPETTDLKVFPYQFILAPNESRNIKINWTGDKLLSTEKSYRILVDQVPVEFSKGKPPGNNINIMTNYSGTIYVSKAGLHPLVTAVSLEKKNGMFILHLKNTGTKRLLFRNVKLEVNCSSDEKKSHTLPKSSMKHIEGHNLLANSEIKYSIPVTQSLSTCIVDKWDFTHE